MDMATKELAEIGWYDAEIARLRAERDEMRKALERLVETVETAIDADLFRSTDGKRPEVQAMAQARAALQTKGGE